MAFKISFINEIANIYEKIGANIEDALKDADICFIFTEWKEIKELNPDIFKKYMKTPIVLDGRNCYNLEVMEKYGIEYSSIGR